MNNPRIKIIKQGGEGHGMYYTEFMLTAASDKSDLPNSQTPAPDTAAIGSQAYTQDMEHTYILGTDDVWREV